jgi:hypothetical protein
MRIYVDKDARLKKAREAADRRGGVLLDDKYRGVDAKVKWRCANGHEFLSSYYSVVSRGNWCAACANRVFDPNKRLAEAREIASLRGGASLSNTYVNSLEHLKWRCAKGHEWGASLGNVKKGKWCPWCAGNRVDPEAQLDRAKNRALSMGGQLLSKTYEGNKTPLHWRCKEGHEWFASFGTVVTRGAWCSLCSGVKVLPEEQLKLARDAATRKSGKCLSKEYLRNSELMDWECERGHRWKAVFYSVVQAGTWCPVCSDGLRERLVRYTFESMLGVQFGKVLPDWLINPHTKRRLELDGFNESLLLAFEYQGEQHNRVVLPFKMTTERLSRQQERDHIKRELCAERGVRLIEIPHHVPWHELPQWVHETLSEYNDLRNLLRPWREVQPTDWLASDTYTISDLCVLANERGGKCLSPTYLGSREKHHWLCSDGHEWAAIWDAVRRGSWCPVCAKPNPQETLKEMSVTAKTRGGELCSTDYLGGRHKYLWRCAEGHEWNARWDSVKSGSWCRVCSHKSRREPLESTSS